MAWLGWVCFIALLLWHFKAMMRQASRQLHLSCYIIYLLLEDSMRQDHKTKLLGWIPTTGVSSAADLGSKAHRVIANMAEQLAAANPGSLLGANAVLWNSEGGLSLRKLAGAGASAPSK